MRVAVVPGDGIGPEVIGAALEVLDAVSARHGFKLSSAEFVDGLNMLRDFDSILLGAVGWPGVPDHVSLWGLLIPIRRTFRQYVNLRPIRTFSGVQTPLREAEFDFVVVRENVEGEYGEAGGRLNRVFPDELAIQESIFTRAGGTRIVDYAFDLAKMAALQQTAGRTAEALSASQMAVTALSELAARSGDTATHAWAQRIFAAIRADARTQVDQAIVEIEEAIATFSWLVESEETDHAKAELRLCLIILADLRSGGKPYWHTALRRTSEPGRTRHHGRSG